MMDTILYKYLDFDGGLAMLKNHNLQFTNATKFNDPFDCHPALFDYSNVPAHRKQWLPAEFVSFMEKNNMENLRNETWICSLSKVNDSLLMWSYYNYHKGICIGLNKDAVINCCRHKFLGLVHPFAMEVQYKDVLQKPDFFNDHPSWIDLLLTKAKVWEHEKEVRLITKHPLWVNAWRNVPKEFQDEEAVDGKEIRHYPYLTKDCFDSVYLGVNMLPKNKQEIIKVARTLNPDIKIYQIVTCPETFSLKAELITL